MAKQVPEKQKTRPDLADAEWLAWLAALPENRGINVRSMHRNMLAWCAKKGVTPTRRRLLKWLESDRSAVPMAEPPAPAPIADPEPETQALPDCPRCSNTRWISVPHEPDSPFEWNRTRMAPCPACKENEAANK